MSEGPRFNAEGEPYFDAVGQPLVCEADATECCDPCVAFLKCLRKSPFVVRITDGAYLIQYLNVGTLDYIVEGGVPDATDDGDTIDVSDYDPEYAWCLVALPWTLGGWGSYEHLDGNRERTVFEGSYVLEPVADVSFPDYSDGDSQFPFDFCDGTHAANVLKWLYLVEADDRGECGLEYLPGAFIDEACDDPARSRPVALALGIECEANILTFKLYLIFERHYWTKADDEEEPETPDDGTYACPCFPGGCIEWLVSDPIDLTTTAPADLVDIELHAADTESCGRHALHGGGAPSALLSMAHPDCDLVHDCDVCEPDEDELTPLVPVEIDFAIDFQGFIDDENGPYSVRLEAVIPECLDVDPDNIIWNNGKTGPIVNHVVETPCTEEEIEGTGEEIPDPLPAYCEAISLIVIDNRGCIYRNTKLSEPGACECEASGSLSITPTENACEWLLEATVSSTCEGAYLEVCAGVASLVQDCDPTDGCLGATGECEVGEGDLITVCTGMADEDTLLIDVSCHNKEIRWRYWDSFCGCHGPWNYEEVLACEQCEHCEGGYTGFNMEISGVFSTGADPNCDCDCESINGRQFFVAKDNECAGQEQFTFEESAFSGEIPCVCLEGVDPFFIAITLSFAIEESGGEYYITIGASVDETFGTFGQDDFSLGTTKPRCDEIAGTIGFDDPFPEVGTYCRGDLVVGFEAVQC